MRTCRGDDIFAWWGCFRVYCSLHGGVEEEEEEEEQEEQEQEGDVLFWKSPAAEGHMYERNPSTSIIIPRQPENSSPSWFGSEAGGGTSRV